MSVSVLILTLDEEINLPDCLDSVSWSDDIVVFDSFSSDKTVEIAASAGARVFQRKFDNWSAHQNWAVQNIDFKYPWVYYTDADELCDLQLKSELLQLDKIGKEYSAFQVRRKDFFMGKWLKRAQLYPTWITRVFRPDKITYKRLVNPIAVVEGDICRLKGHIIHNPFSHGIANWYERHNKYSSMEALDFIQEMALKVDWPAILTINSSQRRGALKQLAYKMPFRPFLIWLYLMFIRGAFLDGIPGINYCFMRAFYEYMINLKVRELLRKERGLPI